MDTSNFKPTPLSLMRERFDEAKYDTSLLVDAALDTIEQALNGEAFLVDPTHPAVMMLEMACAIGAGNTQDCLANLRRQYPILAETWDDLYLHMSDRDFLDRFAKPGRAPFIFAFQMEQLRAHSVYDPTELSRKVILPKYTTVVVDSIAYVLLYPVVVRIYANGMVQASYDVSEDDPLQVIDRNIINIEPKADDWVFMTVDMLQLKITTSMHSIGKSYNFKKLIRFDDQFHYARVYYKNESTQNAWKELVTTHTDQVFSYSQPTACLKVLENELEVSIPVIYTSKNAISGDIRVDIFTTRADQTINLANYTEDKFYLSMETVDPARYTNQYTSAAANVGMRVFSTAISTGGRGQLLFRQVQERVINNSVGQRQIPITNNQLDTVVEDDGFEIVRNVDTLTNLLFLATRRLPVPSNRKLITAANIGMVTYQSNIGAIEDHPQVIRNLNRYTFRSKTLWRNENAVLHLVPTSELALLEQMTDTALLNRVNENQYLYTPFWYVVDTSDKETDLRCYALDQPKASDLRFIRQNQTLQLYVNTQNFALTKAAHGYDLRIQTKSGTFYKELPSSQVGVQLAFYPKGENRLVYINGVVEKRLEDNEYIYLFRIESNHDFDKEDSICITNAQTNGVTNYKAWCELDTEVHLLHYTTSITQSYRPDETDSLLGKWLLPEGAVGVIHERLKVKYGSALSNLWRRARSYYLDTVYRLHEDDVPDVWEEDVFQTNEDGSVFDIVDGEVVYNYLHRKGDPKLDEHGNPILKYKKGSVMLDEQGNPVLDKSWSSVQELDLLVVDGKYLFSNDLATQSYRAEIEAVLESWITTNIDRIKAKTMSGTKVVFYPKTTLGTIAVESENNFSDYISSEQSFVVDLFVGFSVMNNPAIRERLRAATVRVLDAFISQPEINMTTIRDQLKAVYGTSVRALSIRGLGGFRNYQVLRVKDAQNKLCIKKNLVRQPDRTFIVEDAVEVNFKLFD